jgi:hypothetical protein
MPSVRVTLALEKLHRLTPPSGRALLIKTPHKSNVEVLSTTKVAHSLTIVAFLAKPRSGEVMNSYPNKKRPIEERACLARSTKGRL